MSGLDVVDIHVRYGPLKVLNGVSLSVEDGRFMTLLGPSGCGKTTLLRVISGFSQPERGEIYIKGERVDQKPTYKRGIGLVFQNYALFPHMTVFDNVAYGLKMRKLSRPDIARRVKKVLELIRLSGYEDRLPRQLSGGEQQRVAMARALVIEPKILLLDEPLSNLDLKLRQHLRLEIKSIQSKTGVTTLYVTHDQMEALVMSDNIALLKNGIIQQVGTPTEIYEQPINRFVAGFVGEGNIFEGKLFQQEGSVVFLTDDELTIHVSEDRLTRIIHSDEKPVLCVRPEKISISEKSEGYVNTFQGEIEEIVYEGATVRYSVSLTPSRTILVIEQVVERAPMRALGDRVYVHWSPKNSGLVSET